MHLPQRTATTTDSYAKCQCADPRGKKMEDSYVFTRRGDALQGFVTACGRGTREIQIVIEWPCLEGHRIRE